MRSYFWGLLVTWTLLVSLLLFWGVYREKKQIEEAALIQARFTFEKDLVYRRWAAVHGGVYVPATKESPPSLYLSNIEERDITTPSGKKLTLINPAYMTRQVHEMGKEQYGLLGHITSLNLKRPENVADVWETKALQGFEHGVKEVSEIKKINGQDYMRLMKPMLTEQSCLKCHAEQGYKVGDIRGGISVSVPMRPLYAIGRKQMATMAIGHGILWLLGLIGIGAGSSRLRKHVTEQENVARFPSENPSPVLRISTELKLLYCNNACSSLLRQWGCTVDQTAPEELRNVITDAFASGSSRQVELTLSGRTFSFDVVPMVGLGYVNLYGKDISAIKLAEQEIRQKMEELARFNNLMVGRELRMIELKKEVNDLCQRLGLEKKYNLDLDKEQP